MYIHSKQIILLLCATAVAGCISTDATTMLHTETTPDTECVEGKECTIEGNLFVYRGSPASVAEIKTPYRCFAAALAADEYRIYHKRNGSSVRLRGVAYRQSSAENVVSYRLLDRDVATGICSSGLIIYAQKVEFLKAR
jgi:hypothetical protein